MPHVGVMRVAQPTPYAALQAHAPLTPAAITSITPTLLHVTSAAVFLTCYSHGQYRCVLHFPL